MLAVDPATGKSARAVHRDAPRSGHWINLTDNYKLLEDGSLIWWSERDGYGHLYRCAKGRWTQLTRGEWVVTGLAGVDEAGKRVYFTPPRTMSLAQQVYALDLPSRAHRSG